MTAGTNNSSDSGGLEELFQRYRADLKALEVFHQRFAESSMQQFRAQIEDIIRLAGPTLEQFQSQIAEMSRLAQPQKDALQMARRVLDDARLSRQFLDGLDQLQKHQQTFTRNLGLIPPSYFPAPERDRPRPQLEHPLVSRLQHLSPGQSTWPEYQELCEEILSFCFIPPLLEPLVESHTDSRIHRRDLIYQIPADVGGFWAYLRNTYGAHALIVDPKNHKGRLAPNQLVIVSKYFGAKKLGRFGIVVSRLGLGESAKKEQADRWQNHDEMVISLSDSDLEEMLAHKLNGEDAAVVIDHKIFELRSRL